jgi:hypothetical protein
VATSFVWRSIVVVAVGAIVAFVVVVVEVAIVVVVVGTVAGAPSLVVAVVVVVIWVVVGKVTDTAVRVVRLRSCVEVGAVTSERGNSGKGRLTGGADRVLDLGLPSPGAGGRGASTIVSDIVKVMGGNVMVSVKMLVVGVIG